MFLIITKWEKHVLLHCVLHQIQSAENDKGVFKPRHRKFRSVSTELTRSDTGHVLSTHEVQE